MILRVPFCRALAAMAILLIGLFGSGAMASCRFYETEMMRLKIGGIKADEAARARLMSQRLVEAGCRRSRVPVAAPERKKTAEPRQERRGKARQAPKPAAKQAPKRAAKEINKQKKAAPRKTARRSPSKSRTATRSRPKSSGVFRTLCVRTCDGYYFPISEEAERDSFEREAALCKARCPAAEVKLFYHHPLRERPPAMVSLEDEAYVEMPYAFGHFRAYDPSCTCGSQAQIRTALAEHVAAKVGLEELPSLPEPRPEPAPPPLPLPRLAAGLDPETFANHRGGLAPADLIVRPPRVALSRSDEGMRIVGAVDRTVTLLTPMPVGRP